jgi:uncharacterized damage-inducible protein DinB
MVQKTPWFERSFSRDLPVALFPNLVERLRGTPARLEDRIKYLSRDALVQQWEGKWSIQENAGHLLDLEALWLGRLDDFDAGNEKLRPADLKNTRTHEADHNATSLEELLAEFRKARMEMAARLDRMDETAVRRTALHPRLNQPMAVLDLIFFIAEHDDHHLAQITEIMRALKYGAI